MISGLTGRTYEEKCKELGLDTLEERRLNQDMLQTYKICNGKDRIHPDLLFDRVGHNPGRETRFTADPQNILLKRARLEIRKNSFAIRVAENWNSLSNITKVSLTTKAFKSAIKQSHYTGGKVAALRDRPGTTPDSWTTTSDNQRLCNASTGGDGACPSSNKEV